MTESDADEMTGPDGFPLAKRFKVLKEEYGESSQPSKSGEIPAGFADCLFLLETSHDRPTPTMPRSLAEFKTRNQLDKLRQIFDEHGFRTSVVMSPRPALSIYKDSCRLDSNADGLVRGKAFLLSMLGLHPRQADMERWYATSLKKVYCLALFCNLVRKLCPGAASDAVEDALLHGSEELCRSIASSRGGAVDEAHRLAGTVDERVRHLTLAAVKADPRLRVAQFEHEYERIAYRNSTISNALVQLFMDAHDCCIKDVYFKHSHVGKYERISVFLYDSDLDLMRPPRFTFLPAVQLAIQKGAEAVAHFMVDTFWQCLLRHGYFSSPAIKLGITPDLEKYFLSGLTNDPATPLLLNAHFTPVYPMSFYLQGEAGAGKSSLVRNFSPSLNKAIEAHADPEILVRFVKQNLNKPYKDLMLELELRPNNNDRSVMSIIQGRRMTMDQTKPGLVVVGLEEMSNNDLGADPNQLKTAQLISQRFSGRKAEYREGAAPRNSDKRGISGDASLITLFTSNYGLGPLCQDALQKLDMFSNMTCLEVNPIDGDDRYNFAIAYLKHCVQDHFGDRSPSVDIDFNIPVGDGDTRPLVRLLRMVSFYICALSNDCVHGKSRIEASVKNGASDSTFVVSSSGKSISLRSGSLRNLLPVPPRVFDERVQMAMAELRVLSSGFPPPVGFDDIGQILDFFFAKTLAPAVIVSKHARLLKSIVEVVGAQKGVRSITDVDASAYKMMKSLYDKRDTPNLRDDILKLKRGAFVVAELVCRNRDAQLMIRDLIEDSPSMTAFSTSKSALYKDGLLFCVHVLGGEITPEILSRASLVF